MTGRRPAPSPITGDRRQTLPPALFEQMRSVSLKDVSKCDYRRAPPELQTLPSELQGRIPSPNTRRSAPVAPQRPTSRSQPLPPTPPSRGTPPTPPSRGTPPTRGRAPPLPPKTAKKPLPYQKGLSVSQGVLPAMPQVGGGRLSLQPGFSRPSPPARGDRKMIQRTVSGEEKTGNSETVFDSVTNSGLTPTPTRSFSRSRSFHSSPDSAQNAIVQQSELQRKIESLQNEIAESRAAASNGKKVQEKLAMQLAMLEALQTTAAMEQLKEQEGYLFTESFDTVSDCLHSLEMASKRLAATSNDPTPDAVDQILFDGYHYLWFTLTDGTLSFFNEKESPTAVGSLQIRNITRLIKASVDPRIFVLQSKLQVVVLAAETQKDAMLWVSSFVAVNESIEVAEANDVRKELRSKRSSASSTKAARDVARNSPRYLAGCARAAFVPVAALFSEQLAVEFKAERVYLEAGTLSDLCLWVILAGHWDSIVLLQSYGRFTTPEKVRRGLEDAWLLMESKLASDPRLSIEYSANLAFICSRWLSEVYVTDRPPEEQEQRRLFREFCSSRVRNIRPLMDYELPQRQLSSERSGVLSIARFVDISTDVLSTQFAIVDCRYFARCGAQDFVNDAWNSSAESGLKRIIKLSNQISAIVSFVILSTSEKKGRERLFNKFIAVANRLHSWNCCNTALSVLAGLSRTAVSRLKLDEALASKHRNRYDKLQQFYSPVRNFNEYRKLLVDEPYNTTATPLLPIVAVLLKDLTFIEDGNADILNKGSGGVPTINWYKIHCMSVVINHVTRAREVSIQGRPDEELIASISTFDILSDDHLYEMSLKLLPIKVSMASLESKVASLTSLNESLSDELSQLHDLKDSLASVLQETKDPAEAVSRCLALLRQFDCE